MTVPICSKHVGSANEDGDSRDQWWKERGFEPATSDRRRIDFRPSSDPYRACERSAAKTFAARNCYEANISQCCVLVAGGAAVCGHSSRRRHHSDLHQSTQLHHGRRVRCNACGPIRPNLACAILRVRCFLRADMGSPTEQSMAAVLARRTTFILRNKGRQVTQCIFRNTPYGR